MSGAVRCVTRAGVSSAERGKPATPASASERVRGIYETAHQVRDVPSAVGAEL
jgi:hypothetical protein